ncbi:hypothetical protein BOX15_Mlig011486g3, partial [Macrostomum lignano]
AEVQLKARISSASLICAAGFNPGNLRVTLSASSPDSSSTSSTISASTEPSSWSACLSNPRGCRLDWSSNPQTVILSTPKAKKCFRGSVLLKYSEPTSLLATNLTVTLEEHRCSQGNGQRLLRRSPLSSVLSSTRIKPLARCQLDLASLDLIDPAGNEKSLELQLDLVPSERMAKKIESGSVSLTLHSVVQNPLALLLTQSIPVDQSDTMTENQTKAVTIKANRSLSDLDMSELEQLFTWARESTANCPGAVVQNLSTSFRSGLAFCAIVERHRPRLLDYGAAAELAATGPSGWLQCHLMAAEAARRLGVTRLPDPAELISRRTPDVPTVLDFLQQLRRCLALSSPHCDQIDHHQTDMQDVEIVDIVDHSPDAAMQLLIRRQQELVDERCCLNRLCADLSDCLSRSATPGSGAVAAGVRGLLADWYSLLMRRLLLHNRWQQLELMQRELQQLNRLESLKRRIRRHLQAGQCQSLDPKLSRELARELKRRDRLLAQLDRLEIRSATEQQMATRAICQAAAADAVDDASKGSWQACSLL